MKRMRLAALLLVMGLLLPGWQDASPPNIGMAAPGCATVLRWAAPPLENPQTRVITTPGTVRLDAGRDYRLEMPQVVRGGVAIRGGRNVVLVGGEISIPMQPGSAPSITSRRGLYILEQTGTVHIEGLRITGEDLSEAIQIAAPNAIVQLVNIAAYGVHSRDQVGFTDNHSDIVQPWGGARELRIDYLSGSSDYQGIFLSPDFNTVLGEMRLSHISFAGLPTARYLFWVAQNTRVGPVWLEQVYIDVPAQRGGGFGKSIWPDVQSPLYAPTISLDSANRTIAFWTRSTAPIDGWVTQGLPEQGHFVPAECVGVGYRRPEQQEEIPAPTAAPTATETPTLAPSPTMTARPPEGFAVSFEQSEDARRWCRVVDSLLDALDVAHVMACP